MDGWFGGEDYKSCHWAECECTLWTRCQLRIIATIDTFGQFQFALSLDKVENTERTYTDPIRICKQRIRKEYKNLCRLNSGNVLL